MIIAAGDSFVYGSELASSANTFTALLGADECIAWPGFGNDSIARTTIERCDRDDVTGVIVSWTFPGRYEFRFDYDTKQKKSPWYTINSWTIKQDMSEIEQELFTKDAWIIAQQIATIDTAKRTGVADFANTFYKHVGATEYWEIYSSLKEIVYLQNYLKVKNIPFLFTCADTILFYNSTILANDTVVQSLYSQIDFSHWYMFAPGSGTNQTANSRGFYQWAIENKYPVGATHPLEQAHAAAAKLIQEKFNEMVKKSL